MKIRDTINWIKTELNWKQRTSDAPKAFRVGDRKSTLEVIKNSDNGIDISDSYDNVEDMMKELGGEIIEHGDK